MQITSQTMLDVLLSPALLEQVNALRVFGAIRGDGEIGDIYCFKHSRKMLKDDPDFDCVEILDIRKDDHCCLCETPNLDK